MSLDIDDTPDILVIVEEAPAPAPIIIVEEAPEVIVIDEGQRGPKGDQGEPGVNGDFSILDIPFTIPDNTWYYVHDLGRFPLFKLLDDNGTEIQADVSVTSTTITVSFGSPQTGHLILL